MFQNKSIFINNAAGKIKVNN